MFISVSPKASPAVPVPLFKTTVTPADAGIWEFQRTQDDDRAGFWLDLSQDGVFDGRGVIEQNDNYSNLWVGFITPDVSGNWGFRNAGDDDRAGERVDSAGRLSCCLLRSCQRRPPRERSAPRLVPDGSLR